MSIGDVVATAKDYVGAVVTDSKPLQVLAGKVDKLIGEVKQEPADSLERSQKLLSLLILKISRGRFESQHELNTKLEIKAKDLLSGWRKEGAEYVRTFNDEDTRDFFLKHASAIVLTCLIDSRDPQNVTRFFDELSYTTDMTIRIPEQHFADVMAVIQEKRGMGGVQ